MRQTTLCLLVKEQEILLAMKKRGFGACKWNGYGGKPEPGEGLASAGVRETAGGVGGGGGGGGGGEPMETEEMRPQWFRFEDIPFEQMWLEDKYWMPKFLAGQKFEGEFYYNHDGTAIEKFDLRDMNAGN